MIYQTPFPLKKIGLWSLFISMGLIQAYVAVIAVISIRMGVNHPEQDGFWIPIAVGIIIILGSLFFFLFLARFILYLLKEKAPLDM